MSTFTKEQLMEKLQHRISVSSGFPESEKAQMDLELARIALASLKAEPVGEVVLGEYDDCGCHPDARVVCIAADGQADWENFKDGTRLFTSPPTSVVNAEPVSFDALRDAVAEVSGAPAMEWSDIYKGHQPVPFINFNSLARIVDKFRSAPPAPVSVPDERYQHLSELYHAQEKRLFKLAQRIKGPSFDKYAYSPSLAIDVLESAIFGERKDEDCRAAMLQGVEPVTTANKLPDGWVACSERMPENKPGSYEYLVFESLNNGVHHDYWNVPDVGDDCQFTPFWNHYDRYVTHWMPLPSPPAK